MCIFHGISCSLLEDNLEEFVSKSVFGVPVNYWKHSVSERDIICWMAGSYLCEMHVFNMFLNSRGIVFVYTANVGNVDWANLDVIVWTTNSVNYSTSITSIVYNAMRWQLNLYLGDRLVQSV